MTKIKQKYSGNIYHQYERAAIKLRPPVYISVAKKLTVYLYRFLLKIEKKFFIITKLYYNYVYKYKL